MDIKKLDRTDLKSFFVKNAAPTAGNFADLIDGLVNQKEDGIAKLPGEPLSVQADGAETSQKKALNFYKNFADPKPAWTLSLNPRVDPNNAASAKPGWSLGDGDGNSKFFVDQSSGNVGIGTVDPGGYKLNVQGGALFTGNYLFANAENAGRLRVGAAWGMPGLYSGDDGAKALMLGAPPGQKVYLGQSTGDAYVESGSGNSYFKGNVGIGVAAPSGKLQILAQNQDASGGVVILGPTNQSNLRLGYHGDYSWIQAHGSKPLAINPIGNNVGIGTTAPAGTLDVKGTVVVSNGNNAAVRGNYMAAGSLSVGSTNTSYGGGRGWNSNIAGLLLETSANTEIAVHDSSTRIASLMYYEGDGANRITIGRDMGFGAIGNVVLNGKVGIGTTAPAGALDVRGVVAISNGTSYAVSNNHMAPGSLTIGSSNVNYGGGSRWNNNTAGLLLETSANTEIAVGDAGTRVASLMYYEGDNANRITIGRDMGFGPINQVVVSSAMAVGGAMNVAGDVAVHGKHAIRGSDAWLRLNQDGAFTSGVHTPGLFAPMSLNVGGVNGWSNPGKGNVEVAGNVKVTGSIGCGGKISLKSYHNTYVGVTDHGAVYGNRSKIGGWEMFTLEMGCSRDIKENICALSDKEAMATLERLSPVKYDYKGERLFRQNLGFIAEEMPDNLASENRKTISPFEVTPVLTKVAQEQQKLLLALRQKIDALEEAMQRQQSQLEKLQPLCG